MQARWLQALAAEQGIILLSHRVESRPMVLQLLSRTAAALAVGPHSHLGLLRPSPSPSPGPSRSHQDLLGFRTAVHWEMHRTAVHPVPHRMPCLTRRPSSLVGWGQVLRQVLGPVLVPRLGLLSLGEKKLLGMVFLKQVGQLVRSRTEVSLEVGLRQ